MSKYQIIKRTFEAKMFWEGSPERAELNKSVVTSEYMPSHKYAIIGNHFSNSKRTKAEAESFVENLERVPETVQPFFNSGI
jgi:arylamine N-acetyltransferase